MLLGHDSGFALGARALERDARVVILAPILTQA